MALFMSSGFLPVTAALKNQSGRLAITSINNIVRGFKADIPIKGKITDQKTLEALIGVSVKVKGTNIGVSTDVNGNYSLDAPENGTLVITYIGYETIEVSVNNRGTINIPLVSSIASLDEVVVTALGITRQKKALGYSVGVVKSEMMDRVPQQNLLGALAGRVAGMQINSTSQDINAEVIVNIRGITSLAGNNAPLVIVDGVPTGDQKVMKDISPNDIESVTVLKGPSAAALYGSRAGNGVILITRKTGKMNKNGIGVDVNVGSTYSVPYKYINLQNRFTSGKSGVFNENLFQQWYGPERGTSAVQWNTNGESKPLVFYDNSLKDFFQTGLSTVVDASVNGSYDRGSFRFSLSQLDAVGVYPGVELKRNGVALSVIYDITKKLKLSTNIDISNPNSGNYPVRQGDLTQFYSVYQTPPHVNINDLKDYWITPGVQQRTVSTNYDNPFFASNEQKNKFDRMRGYGSMKLDYQILPDLKVMGRYAFNSNNEKKSYEQPWSSYSGDGGGWNRPRGLYTMSISNMREMNADFLVSYQKKFGKFEFQPSVGGNMMTQRSYGMYAGGDNLVLPGLYTLSNVTRGGFGYSSGTSKKNIYSAYAIGNLSYNNMVYLDVTARNDWSSTLPVTNRSYFYPSASLSVLLNEMLPLPSWVSLLKLRSGMAKVGKDTDPYVIASVLNQGTWGNDFTYSVPGSLPNINLKPEIATSFEIGTDMSFLNNRIGFDFTYYKVDNQNQILNAATSTMSGYAAALINAGSVQNKGFEIGVNAVPVKTSNLTWDLNVNFSRERSQLKALTPGINQFQFWDATQFFAKTKIGGYIGDIYTRDMLRVEEGTYKGWALLNANGKMQMDNVKEIMAGNFLPDFRMGLQSSVTYKRVTISFSFDWRQGGVYKDETMWRLGRSGKIERLHPNANSITFSGIIVNNTFHGNMSALANEIKTNPEIYQNNTWIGGRTQDLGGFPYMGANDGSFYPGVIPDGNGGYKENFGGTGTQMLPAWDVYSPGTGFWTFAGVNKWIYDASFIKLRETAISYMLPKSISGKLHAQNITISAFMKNVILWTAAKTNTDPESSFKSNDGTTQLQGLANWNGLPVIMPAGFQINVTF